MGEDPDAIRQDIERTRESMGDTIEALGYKADVPSRTREAVQDKVSTVKEKVGLAGSRVSDATPSGEDVKQGAQRAVGIAQENPLGLAIGSVAVGFVAGLLIPSSRVEHEKLGPVADRVKEQARETGQEALEHGKQVAQEAAQSAKETAQEGARERGQDLASSAQDSAQQVQEAARDQVRSSR